MASSPRKIFLVEDDEHIRLLVETLLKGAGYEILCTGQPQEALEIARREMPDLVLCDIAMPVLDGYGVLRDAAGRPRDRTHTRWCSSPPIASSASACARSASGSWTT